MKQSRACAILSIAALCALLSFSPRKAYADALLYMELTGVQGAKYNGEDVYPYYGTANGNPVTLMCISFTAGMNLGETWIAEKESIPDSSTYKEAVWLFNDANAAIAAGEAATKAGETAIAAEDTTVQIADQWAAWELFSADAYTNPAPGTATQMAAAVADYASEPASFYQGFILYAPVPGSQSELGTPQFFLGVGTQTPNTTSDPYGGSPDSPAYGVTPEPSSLILLGSGLLGLAGFMWRRRRAN